MSFPMEGDLLTIIPARGGSQRLRRKNLLPLDGIPLFLRAAQAAPGKVVVSTDDTEIASMARIRGLDVHHRSPVDPDQTIAEMARSTVADLAWAGDVLVIQPTVQPLTREHVLPMVRIGRVRDVPLVASRYISHYQWLVDRTLGIDYELGVYFWPAGRVGDQPEIHHELGPEDFVDIDTPKDFLAAQYRPAKILIDAAEPSHQFGSGHWKRAETLSLALQHHDVQIGHSDDPPADWDIVIVDKGDTYISDVVPHQEAGAKVITVEDTGVGAFHADLVINSFVGPLKLTTERHGPEWAVLRSEFLALPPYVVETSIYEVLVVLGGTDARNMSDWVCEQISELGIDAKLHKGPGIAEAMYNADLFISGAGRAVQEAAYVGVPTMIIPTTLREATHTHLGPRRGNLVLPVAGLVTKSQISEAVHNLALDFEMRKEMSQVARSFIDGKGLSRVVHAIEGMLI